MSRTSRRQFLATGTGLGASLIAPPLLAQTDGAGWPNGRPVRIVVAFAAGGSLDAIARRMTAHFQSEFGGNFIVDNRAGAGGRIGTAHVGKSPGDGYTLITTSSAAHGVAPNLYNDLGYEPMKEFTHLGLICSGPMALMVRADAPYRTLDELVAHLKKTDSPLMYGSGGIGSLGHLTGALIGQTLGVPIEHVSYKGSMPAQVDLLGGSLMAVSDNMSSHAAQVRSGKIRVLGLAANARFPTLPDAPTYAEQGHPNLIASAWYGFSGSAGIPAEVVAKLNGSLKRLCETPDFRDMLLGMTMVPEGRMSSQVYTDFVASEIKRWGDVVRANHITVN